MALSKSTEKLKEHSFRQFCKIVVYRFRSVQCFSEIHTLTIFKKTSKDRRTLSESLLSLEIR